LPAAKAGNKNKKGRGPWWGQSSLLSPFSLPVVPWLNVRALLSDCNQLKTNAKESNEQVQA